MAGKIFINYRRGQNRKDAQHLFTQLLLHFPRHRLFIDEKGLDNAPDWLHELERQVADSVVMLALIGPGWADARGERGERRSMPARISSASRSARRSGARSR